MNVQREPDVEQRMEHQCNRCLYHSLQQFNFTRHYACHFYNGRFTCPAPGCGFSLDTKNHVIRHMRMYHLPAAVWPVSKKKKRRKSPSVLRVRRSAVMNDLGGHKQTIASTPKKRTSNIASSDDSFSQLSPISRMLKNIDEFVNTHHTNKDINVTRTNKCVNDNKFNRRSESLENLSENIQFKQKKHVSPVPAVTNHLQRLSNTSAVLSSQKEAEKIEEVHSVKRKIIESKKTSSKRTKKSKTADRLAREVKQNNEKKQINKNIEAQTSTSLLESEVDEQEPQGQEFLGSSNQSLLHEATGGSSSTTKFNNVDLRRDAEDAMLDKFLKNFDLEMRAGSIISIPSASDITSKNSSNNLGKSLLAASTSALRHKSLENLKPNTNQASRGNISSETATTEVTPNDNYEYIKDSETFSQRGLKRRGRAGANTSTEPAAIGGTSFGGKAGANTSTEPATIGSTSDDNCEYVKDSETFNQIGPKMRGRAGSDTSTEPAAIGGSKPRGRPRTNTSTEPTTTKELYCSEDSGASCSLPKEVSVPTSYICSSLASHENISIQPPTSAGSQISKVSHKKSITFAEHPTQISRSKRRVASFDSETTSNRPIHSQRCLVDNTNTTTVTDQQTDTDSNLIYAVINNKVVDLNWCCPQQPSELPLNGMEVRYTLKDLQSAAGTISCGQLIFAPKYQKPVQVSKKHCITYKVEEGEAIVKVQTKKQIVRVGWYFHIPLGAEYTIINLKDEPLILSFHKISH